MKKKVLLLILVSLFLLSPISFAANNSDNIAKSKACVKQAQKCFEKLDVVNTEKKLKEAIQLNDKNDEAYIELGHLEAYGKNFNEAVDYYAKAISINPEKYEYYTVKGATEHLILDYKSAIKDLNKAIELHPKNEFAYYHLALMYYYFGYIKEALEYSNKSIQYSDGKNLEHYELRARIKLSLKDYEGSIADYKKVLAIAKKEKQYEQSIMSITHQIDMIQKGMEVFK